LLTGSEDGIIRVYLADIDFQLIQKMVSPTHSSILSLNLINNQEKTILAIEVDKSQMEGEKDIVSVTLQQYVTGI